ERDEWKQALEPVAGEGLGVAALDSGVREDREGRPVVDHGRADRKNTDLGGAVGLVEDRRLATNRRRFGLLGLRRALTGLRVGLPGLVEVLLKRRFGGRRNRPRTHPLGSL